MIQTVQGLVNKEEIAFCHSHEHLFLENGIPATINPALRIDDYDLTVEELFQFKKIGGTTIVDAQPLGCGRIEESLYSASVDTGIHIIAATGFHKLIFYPDKHWIHTFSLDQLTQIFIHELNKGMYMKTEQKDPSHSLSYRAGFIKVAIDDERMNDKEKKWFHAAAEASLETGFPIMVHTESGTQALYISEFFLRCEIAPEKLIICHLDRTLDNLDVHIDIAKKGIFIEYDTIGRFKYHSNEKEAKLISYMVTKGLEDNILLGLDTTRERLKSYGGEIGLTHLKEVFLPMLKELNVTEKIIRKMVAENPAKAFSNNLLKGDKG